MGLGRSCVSLFVLACLAAPAGANDFVLDDPADWLRYENADGDVLTSQIERVEGSWRLWSEFAGLGQRWVYTESGHDWLWVWNGSVGEVFGNLSDMGSSLDAELDAVNDGAIKVVSTGRTVSTVAGSFTRVTHVTLETQDPTDGVSEIWFAEDVGVIKFERQTSAGPERFELTSALIGGTLYGSTTQPSTSVDPVSPAEHEATEAVLWGCDDTYLVLDTYVDSFTALDGQSPRVLSDVSVSSQATASELAYELAARGVPTSDVEIYVVALDTVWLRDYGPFVMKDSTGQRVVGDANYYWNRLRDDAFPDVYAQFRGWPRIDVDLEFEGGNFMSDGRGLGMASEGAVWFNPDKTRSQVADAIAELGCERVVFVEPLIDEGTTHIDMFAKIVSDTDAIVSSYPVGHRQKRVVDDAADTMRGLGYTVRRVETHVGHDEYATYANAVLANGVALVPQYGSASRDAAALRAYERAGFVARGVDCRLLIQYGGAVHCISMQVPR